MEARNAVSSFTASLGLAAVTHWHADNLIGDNFNQGRRAGRNLDITVARVGTVAQAAPARKTENTALAPSQSGTAASVPATRAIKVVGWTASLPDSAFAASVITLSTPAPVAQTKSAGAPQSSAGGGNAGSPPASSATAPIQAADESGIRPMALAATTPGSTATIGTGPVPLKDSATGSGVGALSSGSGGNPTLSSLTSWSTLDENPVLPNYTISNGVSIGAKMSWLAVPPAGETFKTIAWQGGSTAATYTLGPDPTAAAPLSMKVGTPVVSDQAGYTFIVDNQARQYNVQVHVVYTDNLMGDASVTFTSFKPTTADLKNGGGQGAARYYDDKNGSAVLSYDRFANPLQPAGIYINANTKTDKFAGQFMFLQVVTIQRFATAKLNGQLVNLTTPNTPDPNDAKTVGPEIDNSSPGAGGAVGFPVFDSFPLLPPNTDKTLPNGWHMPATANYTQFATMGDLPSTNWPFSTMRSLSVGGAGGNESFDMYLMFRPDGKNQTDNAWVPTSKIHWEWGMSVTQTDLGVITPGMPQNPAPGAPVPYPAEWPHWTDTTTAVYSRGAGGWIQK